MSALIEIKDLVKSYGNKVVLDDFNCVINEGDFLMITGESGIGKSTLLNIISLVDKLTSGIVTIEKEKWI